MTTEELINDVDDTLRMLRGFMLDAGKNEKPKMMDRINTALDRRLELMKARDAEKPEDL